MVANVFNVHYYERYVNPAYSLMASWLAEISNLASVFPDGWTNPYVLNAQRILRVCYRGSAL
jgi:hypothetical protein